MGINLKDYDFKFDEEDKKFFEEFMAPYVAQWEDVQREYDKITPKSFMVWLQEKISIINETGSVYIETEDSKTDAHVKYLKDKVDVFLKENELDESHYAPDGLEGYEYMFTQWLSAWQFNGDKYIAEEIYGQGETIFSIFNPYKEKIEEGYNGYKSITNYLNIEDIFGKENDDERNV